MNDVAIPQTKAPTIGRFKSLRQCKTIQEALDTKEFQALVTRALPKFQKDEAEHMVRAMVQAANRSPKDRDGVPLVYRCDLKDAIGKFLALAWLGLPPGSDLGFAHLIPFERTKWVPARGGQPGRREHVGYDLQVIIGYSGYCELAYRSGFVKEVATGAVYSGDFFEFERGTNQFIRHRPSLEIDNTGNTPYACWARFGFERGEASDVMPWPAIARIRDNSQSYRRAKAIRDSAEIEAKEKGRRFVLPLAWSEAPWVKFEAEMGRKTVLRSTQKLVPRCPEMRMANAFEGAQEAGEQIDYSPLIDGEAGQVEEGGTAFTSTPASDASDNPDGPPEDQTSDPGHGSDPGAAFTDRRETNSGPSREQTRHESNAPVDKPVDNEDKPGLWDFGPAALYNAEGHEETADGDWRYNPVEFAKIVRGVWRLASFADRDAFMEYNSGWIEEARQWPEAASILAEMDDQEAERPIAAVEVPVGRGNRPSYSAYFKLLETSGAQTPTPEVARWLDEQQPVVTGLPFAQRVQAVRLMTATAARAKVGLPRWATEAIAPEAKEEPRAEKPETPDHDVEWVDRRMKQLAAIRGISPVEQAQKAYADLMDAPPVVDKLITMQERNFPQWKRLTDAAAKTREEIGIPHTLPGQGG